MIEAAVHEHENAEAPSEDEGPGGRVRTCAGCGERVPQNEGEDMVRLVLSPDGIVAVDAKGGGFGRGAHLHARPECLERAVSRGLSRSAKTRVEQLATAAGELVPLTRASLAEAIRGALDRRVQGLLVSALRSKRLVFGSDAVTGACRREEADLVVVARDAAAAADLGEVRRAVAEGRAVAWGTKERLGQLVHPGRAARGDAPEVGVLAIASRNLAAAIRDAVHSGDAVVTVGAEASVRAKPRAASRRTASETQAPGACAPPPEGGKLRPPSEGGRKGPARSPGGGSRGHEAAGITRRRRGDG